jgi:hypothetical protein
MTIAIDDAGSTGDGGPGSIVAVEVTDCDDALGGRGVCDAADGGERERRGSDDPLQTGRDRAFRHERNVAPLGVIGNDVEIDRFMNARSVNRSFVVFCLKSFRPSTIFALSDGPFARAKEIKWPIGKTRKRPA